MNQSDKKEYPDQVTLEGNSRVPRRIYSAADIMKIVSIQSHARRLLQQRKYNRILMNPEKYLNADYSSRYSQYASNYANSVVQEKMDDLTEFQWNDQYSEE